MIGKQENNSALTESNLNKEFETILKSNTQNSEKIKLLEELLEKGANIESRIDYQYKDITLKLTPLLYALKTDKEPFILVEFLLENTANPNACVLLVHGRTTDDLALKIAIEKYSIPLVKLLLKFGANPNSCLGRRTSLMAWLIDAFIAPYLDNKYVAPFDSFKDKYNYVETVLRLFRRHGFVLTLEQVKEKSVNRYAGISKERACLIVERLWKNTDPCKERLYMIAAGKGFFKRINYKIPDTKITSFLSDSEASKLELLCRSSAASAKIAKLKPYIEALKKNNLFNYVKQNVLFAYEKEDIHIDMYRTINNMITIDMCQLINNNASTYDDYAVIIAWLHYKISSSSAVLSSKSEAYADLSVFNDHMIKELAALEYLITFSDPCLEELKKAVIEMRARFWWFLSQDQQSNLTKKTKADFLLDVYNYGNYLCVLREQARAGHLNNNNDNNNENSKLLEEKSEVETDLNDESPPSHTSCCILM